jgi:mono/diheme cytochrome c family protein
MTVPSDGPNGVTDGLREGPVVRDLPVADPGLPRFVLVVALLAAVGALWLAMRPSEVVPLESVRDEVLPEVVEEPEGTSGGMIFVREGCGECHVTTGPSTALGPSLAGVGARAEERVRSPEYTGHSDNARDYVREATLDHCADVVPGYECVELSDVGLRLSPAEVDSLVDFMLGLPAPEGAQ